MYEQYNETPREPDLVGLENAIREAAREAQRRQSDNADVIELEVLQ